jgi:hypothetical protein
MRLALARLVTRLVVDYFADAMRLALARLIARLVVDYFADAVRLALARLVARLVVDYFAHVARPGASARRAAPHAARRRLLRPRRASGCLGTSRGTLCG